MVEDQYWWNRFSAISIIIRPTQSKYGLSILHSSKSPSSTTYKYNLWLNSGVVTNRNVRGSISVQDAVCFSHKCTHICPLIHTQIKCRRPTCSNQIWTLLNFYGWCKYVQAELRKPDASNRWRADRNFPGTAIGDVCRAAAYRGVKKNSIWVCVCASEWVIGREMEREALESLNDWTDSIESMTQWQIPDVLNHLPLSARDK